MFFLIFFRVSFLTLTSTSINKRIVVLNKNDGVLILFLRRVMSESAVEHNRQIE